MLFHFWLNNHECILTRRINVQPMMKLSLPWLTRLRIMITIISHSRPLKISSLWWNIEVLFLNMSAMGITEDHGIETKWYPHYSLIVTQKCHCEANIKAKFLNNIHVAAICRRQIKMFKNVEIILKLFIFVMIQYLDWSSQIHSNKYICMPSFGLAICEISCGI